MAKEIERKFLVKNQEWRGRVGDRESGGEGVLYTQGYLPTCSEECTVRVRVANNRGFITIKGPTSGATRMEYEYEIPLADANEMLENLCQKPLIIKKRYKIKEGPITWEIDEFLGENQGLIIAEVELKDESQPLTLPNWVGEEVTFKPEYYNVNLAKNPFTKWQK